MIMKRLTKRLSWFVLLVFLLLNVILCFQAYTLTHYDPTTTGKTADPHNLSSWQKLVVITTGIHNPRPVAKRFPDTTFLPVVLNSNKRINGWLIPVQHSKGTVILFH